MALSAKIVYSKSDTWAHEVHHFNFLPLSSSEICSLIEKTMTFFVIDSSNTKLKSRFSCFLLFSLLQFSSCCEPSYVRNSVVVCTRTSCQGNHVKSGHVLRTDNTSNWSCRNCGGLGQTNHADRRGGPRGCGFEDEQWWRASGGRKLQSRRPCAGRPPHPHDTERRWRQSTEWTWPSRFPWTDLTSQKYVPGHAYPHPGPNLRRADGNLQRRWSLQNLLHHYDVDCPHCCHGIRIVNCDVLTNVGENATASVICFCVSAETSTLTLRPSPVSWLSLTSWPPRPHLWKGWKRFPIEHFISFNQFQQTKTKGGTFVRLYIIG